MNFVDGNVIGADVSFWQDDNTTPQKIDFTKMVAQKASFVIIRAGQNAWIDPDFADNWKNAKAAGLPRGAYWFYDSRYDPVRQAELCASLFKNDSPEIELFLDLEESYGGTYTGYANWKKFISRIEQLLPSVNVGIYTGYYYISGKIPQSEYAYFSKYPLWLAWYNIDPSVVRIPAPWTSCLYWQWGTPPWGLAWGCESIEIDMNKFNGTKNEFNVRYGLGGIEPPPPGGNVIYQGTVTASALNVRPAPNTSNTPYYSILNGTKVEADRIENGWWHLTKIEGRVLEQGGDYWAYEGSTKGYIRLDATVEPPPPQELPAYFVAYDSSNNPLGRYNKQ